jgi:hypothetical protein
MRNNSISGESGKVDLDLEFLALSVEHDLVAYLLVHHSLTILGTMQLVPVDISQILLPPG